MVDEAKAPLRVAVVDDDPACLSALKDILEDSREVVVVGVSTDAPGILPALRAGVEAVFLDIEMDGADGLRLARHIQAEYPRVQIVFQTGHAGYALDGYEFQPADFLVKPVDAMKIERSLAHIRSRLDGAARPPAPADARIGIKTGPGISIVDVGDVLYIAKVGRHVYIECADGSRILTTQSLQSLESIFLDYGFIRCHQSFIVSLDRIREVQPDRLNRRSYALRLEGVDRPIPLSRDRLGVVEDGLRHRGVAIFKA